MNAASPDPARRASRRGQAALEYVLVFIAFAAAVYAACRFLRAPGKVARHTVDVICSERL